MVVHSHYKNTLQVNFNFNDYRITIRPTPDPQIRKSMRRWLKPPSHGNPRINPITIIIIDIFYFLKAINLLLPKHIQILYFPGT